MTAANKGRSFAQTRLFWGVMLAVILGLLAYGRWNNVRAFTFTVAPDGAQSATVNIELGEGIIDIHGGDDLFTADIRTAGVVELTQDIDATADIELAYFEPSFLVRWLFGSGDSQLDWDITLSDTVPLALNLSGGVGQIEANLQDIRLTELNIAGGVGDFIVTLPRTPSRYPVDILTNAGQLQVNVIGGAALDLNIQGDVGSTDVTFGQAVDAAVTLDPGVGDVSVTVPDGAAVRVEGVEGGLGSINVPESFTEVSGGAYENASYAAAAQRITITYEGGIGDFELIARPPAD